MGRSIEIQNIFLQEKMCGILSTEGVLIWCESEEALHLLSQVINFSTRLEY